jgi:hypothetical protein
MNFHEITNPDTYKADRLALIKAFEKNSLVPYNDCDAPAHLRDWAT